MTARTESTRPANTARHFVPAGRELVIGSESGEATVVQATAEQGVWADVPVNAPTMVRNLRTAPTAAEMNAALATNRPFGDAPKPGALALEYLSVKASQSATGTSQACICLGDLRALIARCEAAEKEYARRGEALAEMQDEAVKWRADAERAEARANLAESAASNLSQQRAELIADLDSARADAERLAGAHSAVIARAAGAWNVSALPSGVTADAKADCSRISAEALAAHRAGGGK